jgi:hypothetical protein
MTYFYKITREKKAILNIKNGMLVLVASLLIFSATVKKKAILDKELKEISGWVFVNDSTIVAHNDSGDDPRLFILELNGEIRHKTKLLKVKNVDFEDITFDGKKHLYLGDFGNNDNNRKDLVIYKINLDDILSNTDTEPKKINFSYEEQTDFPAIKKEKYFDCEAMGFYKDSLYLFTKCRTEPFDGKCMMYKCPTKTGNYKLKRVYYFKVGSRDWYRDAITGASFFKDKLYLTTYNRVIRYNMENKLPKFKDQQSMLPITQKEAVAVNPKSGVVYVADERVKLVGGGNMYTVDFSVKKKTN